MRVKLLGTAAGGGFPQWNCDCRNCRAARAGEARAAPRLQSCVAVGDESGASWFLIGASPDLRAQLESLPRPPGGPARIRVVEGILLPSADLDQVLGLFLLREGDPLRIFATPAVRRAVSEGLNLERVLGSYCGIEWVALEPDRDVALLRADGHPTGLTVRPFPVPGKPPRYRERSALSDPFDTIGFRVVDERTGGRLIVAPGLGSLDDALVEVLSHADALLLDGTFWGEHELAEVRGQIGATPASAMGHLPVGGRGGSLERLAGAPVGRKIYIHVNNTNPMVLDDSPERRRVEASGFEVGRDGWEFRL